MARAKGPYSRALLPILNPPKSKHSKEKLKAYANHWKGVVHIRDLLSEQYIHNGVSLSKIAAESEIGRATVQRFFEFGKGHGKLTYSYFHGPTATTVFGIASAIGYELTLTKRK